MTPLHLLQAFDETGTSANEAVRSQLASVLEGFAAYAQEQRS